MKIILSLILSMIFIYSYGQFGEIEKVEINFKFDDNIPIDAFSKKSDTLDYYLVFGSRFFQDTIIVIQNDSIICYGIIQTDETLSISTKLKIPSKKDPIGIKINNMPKIEIPIIIEKHYIWIDYSRFSKTIIINYSKYSHKIM